MIIFLGLYFANVIGTNAFPNEPVPPVIKMVPFSNIIYPEYLKAEVDDVATSQIAGVSVWKHTKQI